MFKLLKVGQQLRGGRRNIKLGSQTDNIDGLFRKRSKVFDIPRLGSQVLCLTDAKLHSNWPRNWSQTIIFINIHHHSGSIFKKAPIAIDQCKWLL